MAGATRKHDGESPDGSGDGRGHTDVAGSPEAELTLPLADDIEVLRRLVEGTVRATGEEFFASLVRHLAAAIDVQYAFVAEFAGAPARVHTLAFWAKDRLAAGVEWDLAGTPCAEVVAGKLCHHPRDVARLFPQDTALADLGIESYLGVPLADAAGRTVGHLAVFDERPMPEHPRRVHILQIFAARAAAELERLHMERALRESERQFRDLYEEAPLAYVFEDTDTRFVNANRAALELLGIKPEEVRETVGMTLVAPTPTAQDRVHDAFRDIRQGKERGYIELELRRKDDGRPVWVQFYSKPEPDGKHTRTMLVDITERVLAEQERNRLRQENLYLREEIKTEYNFEEIIGASRGLRGALQKVRQVAATDSTVLILGETGTGKELIARALHSNSRRRDKPLIKLNCAALPSGLIESELFGHEKGAFTGATEKRLGRFALAHGGTIFLDEIGEVPPEVQVRLLRVLQEQEFEPVGSPETLKVDVRVIAATNRDLERAVAEGTFRADLFYRLNVFPIELPPLRDRLDDIPILARYFVNKYAVKIGRRLEDVSEATIAQLLAYSWPGNIRELENIIERAVILSPGSILEIDAGVLPRGRPAGVPARPPSLSPAGASGAGRSAAAAAPAPAASAAAGASAPMSAAENERQHMLRTLETTRWVIEGPRGAARLLGLHPNTLRSRMKKLAIARPDDIS